MFEIEKNFILTKKQENLLLKDSHFLGQKIFTDVYYDNNIYELTSKDWWLRTREGKFELKLPLPNNEDGDRYEEIEEENKIKSILKISQDEDLKNSLQQSGYQPFCECRTTRRKYKHGDFNIDLDFAEFEDGFVFNIGEIELMIEDSAKANEAAERISNFSKQFGLCPVKNGKIIEFLKIKKPNHYKILLDLGILE